MSTVEKSQMYDSLKARYEKNFVRKDQLAQYVGLKKITTAEYKEITGEDLVV
ncbi:XkdX family protein [Anaerotignum sp. MB30-C6]|uniref:XkdX family protein n=1 Tax=Anaerotignum sp. MB30-C6 TaxID=3070814 RepID=UPI0027DDD065|nr:XkdX family protein [Anaerotignum sp. MB30-C6]WMI80891.1 XkdX family protein [Anaerotignum sp. MB30-C6]